MQRFYYKMRQFVQNRQHSIITLSQNYQNLDPPPPLFALAQLWYHPPHTHPQTFKTLSQPHHALPPPTPTKAVNFVIL